MPYTLRNGQVLYLDTKQQIEQIRNCTPSPAAWEFIEEEDDIGKVYNTVTICENDVKQALADAGYSPTKENADKVGHSYAVRKAFNENEVSFWLGCINEGINEVKKELTRDGRNNGKDVAEREGQPAQVNGNPMRRGG